MRDQNDLENTTPFGFFFDSDVPLGMFLDEKPWEMRLGLKAVGVYSSALGLQWALGRPVTLAELGVKAIPRRLLTLGVLVREGPRVWSPRLQKLIDGNVVEGNHYAH